MTKVKLKTGDRVTSVSRATVRAVVVSTAQSGKFTTAKAGTGLASKIKK